MRECKVDWCQSQQNNSRGYCRKHTKQLKDYGHILQDRTMYNKNDVVKYKDYAELILRNIKGQEVARTLIDNEDISKALKYKWSLHSNGYVRCMYNGKTTFMHRVLLNLNSKDLEVDHINRNKLDNRKSNLHECEHWLNAINKTINNNNGCFGIVDTKRKLSKPFSVRVIRKGILYNLGYCATIDEAKRVRLDKEIELDQQLCI